MTNKELFSKTFKRVGCYIIVACIAYALMGVAYLIGCRLSDIAAFFIATLCYTIAEQPTKDWIMDNKKELKIKLHKIIAKF